MLPASASLRWECGVFPETEILFEDMEIPEDMILVPPEGIERGFAGLMDAYNAQRVGAGTVALGIAQGAYETALQRANQREQFGPTHCRISGPAMDAC